jgi:hypothetical protein
MFPIHNIDQLLAEDIEYLGTKRKFWFRHAGVRYLFKAEERGTGEDWAEKIVGELAGLLGLPHVIYELAHEFEGERSIQPGVICASFVPPPLALVMGNQLLFDRDPLYPKEVERKYGLREHTVPVVAQTVAMLQPPATEWMQSCPAGIDSALGVFVGYVLLDAWVANQDRHHQNWGAIQQADGVKRLAPTYDHGASLARNLSDEERKDRLETRDTGRGLPHFAQRARSGFHAGTGGAKTLLLHEAFRAFAARDAVAARIWLDKLAAVPLDAVAAIVSQIPSQRMSPITQRFTLELLRCNQQRLLEERA